jgi:hypothetical protein
MAVFVLLVAVIGALVGIGALAFVLAIGLKAKDEKGRAQSLESADVILDEAFQGDPVTYESTPRTLPFEDVVAGAIARGYTLAGQTENPGERKVLVFTKANSDSRTE